MNGARWFQRREDYAPRTTHPDSLLRKFAVSCVKCDAVKLRVVSAHDGETGEVKVWLVCSRCGEREELPLR